jgi:choline dehydrogenase
MSRSARPILHAAPVIEPNYLSDAEDHPRHPRRCTVPAAPGIDPDLYRTDREPKSVRDPTCIDDKAQLDAIRQQAYSVFHPCGTCRMGPDPADSVVDASLRVHGFSGLRVADASIFPTIPSGNTNAPAMMVGERAAELMLAH